jgi:hypothetical protein
LVDTGATLSMVPCTANFSPSGPLLKGADGQPISSWGLIKKTVQFQGKLFTSSFLQAAVAGPILGIDFLRKFKVTVALEIILLVLQRPCPPHLSCLQRPRLFFLVCLVSHQFQLHFQLSCLLRRLLPASCQIRTCSLESQGGVFQL